MKPGRIYSSVSKILRDVVVVLKGGRELSFYFQTLKTSDSILAIWYAILNVVGIRVNETKRLQFLKKVQSVFKSEASFLFGSARSALYSILKSLEFEDQSEVILSGFTCDVVPNAIIQAGMKPVYSDINPTNYGMSPTSLEKSITPKTKAVVIQHTFGIPCDINVLLDIARKHSLYVIEDCAVSLCTKYDGQLTGTFGDAAIFSFELSKTITSCRGGLLTINNGNMLAGKKVTQFYETNVPEQEKKYRIKTLMQLGLSGLFYHPRLLPVGKYLIAALLKMNLFLYSTSPEEKRAQLPKNYLHRLSEEQCVILSRQWEQLPAIMEQSKVNSFYYISNCAEMLKDEFVEYVKKHEINMIRFPLITKKRDDIVRSFSKESFELGLWFSAPISSITTDQEIFGYTKGQCPVSEIVCDEIINLPVHPRVRISDMDELITRL